MPTKTKSNHLSHKQLVFCREYVMDRNGKMAAIRAGYAPHTAEAAASRLLRSVKVQEQLALADQSVVVGASLKADRLAQEYKSIAFSNITDFLNEDGTIALETLKTLPKEVTAAIESVQTITTTNPKTGEVTVNVKLKLYSKTAALESIGRHLGWFEKDNQQKPLNMQVNIHPPVVMNLQRDGLDENSPQAVIPIEGTTIEPGNDQSHAEKTD